MCINSELEIDNKNKWPEKQVNWEQEKEEKELVK
jgi:hypothetical protein